MQCASPPASELTLSSLALCFFPSFSSARTSTHVTETRDLTLTGETVNMSQLALIMASMT